MNPSLPYPRVQSIQPLPGKRLLVGFSGGEERIYDCSPLLPEEAFVALKDDALFRCAQADPHGFGVIWNDQIDLSESELWLHGEPVAATERR